MTKKQQLNDRVRRMAAHLRHPEAPVDAATLLRREADRLDALAPSRRRLEQTMSWAFRLASARLEAWSDPAMITRYQKVVGKVPETLPDDYEREGCDICAGCGAVGAYGSMTDRDEDSFEVFCSSCSAEEPDKYCGRCGVCSLYVKLNPVSHSAAWSNLCDDCLLATRDT